MKPIHVAYVLIHTCLCSNFHLNKTAVRWENSIHLSIWPVSKQYIGKGKLYLKLFCDHVQIRPTMI